MTTIHLSEFATINFKDVYAFVMSQQKNEFEIVITKTMIEGIDERFLIFWEYHIVAYAGEKLNAISSYFAYNVPAAGTPQPFKFQVMIIDLEKFADVLYELVRVFNSNDETETIIDFQLQASEFFNQAYDNRQQAVTWGLLTLANSFLSE